MSITLKFLTAGIKKSAVRRRYPGGLAGFRQDHPGVLEDPYLFGIVSMSGGELEELLARLGEKGIDASECCAVGDQFIGPIERHPHFEFREIRSDGRQAWQLRLIDDDPQVLAEDGARILRHLIAMGWEFSLAEEAER
jgi:hypothetical protein